MHIQVAERARGLGLRAAPHGHSTASKRLIGVAFLSVSALIAQHRIETIAGGVVRSGAPANEVEIKLGSGITAGPSGSIVFADKTNTIRQVAADGTIRTIVGSGLSGFSADGTPASSANLTDPAFPRYAPSGRLYFVDCGNHRIRYVDANSTIATLAGNGIPLRGDKDSEGPALQMQVGYVTDMLVAPSGAVYFADSPRSDVLGGVRVRRVDTDGTVHNVADFTTGLGPWFVGTLLAQDGAGNLYAGGSLDIVRMAPDGTVTRFAGVDHLPESGSTSIQEGAAAVGQYLGNLVSMVGAPDGGVYASVASDKISITTALLRIDASGIVHFVPGGQGIYGQLALSADGRLFVGRTIPLVSSPLNPSLTLDVIEALRPDGTRTVLAGAQPKPAPDGTLARDAWLLSPVSLATTPKGEIFVAEETSCDVRKIGVDGRLTTAVGTGTCAPPDNRPKPANARQDQPPPQQVLVDHEDRLWVSDWYGNFYRVEPDGTFYYPPFPTTPPLIGSGTVEAIDAKDRVYAMASTYMVRIAPDGKVQTITNAGPTGYEMGMDSIGTDAGGTVYFGGTPPATGISGLYRVNDDGSYVRMFDCSGPCGSPFVMDSSGKEISSSLYATDRTGTRPLAGGTTYSGDGPLAQTAVRGNAVALFPNDEVAVLDGGRVRRVVGSDPPKPTFTAAGVVNALSYEGGAISAGEIIAIFGSNFGPGELQVSAPVNNRIPNVVGDTRVFVAGLEAPILAVTPTQINAVVPMALGGTSPLPATVRVVVQVGTVPSDPVEVGFAASVFGLAAADASGRGQGAIVNQDGSINAAANPAPPGSVVSLYGTGGGVLEGVLFDNYGYNPAIPDGSLVLFTPYPGPSGTVEAAIGGQRADVLYWGAAPTLVLGAIQLNARIPADLGPGSYSITVKVNGVEARPVMVALQ